MSPFRVVAPLCVIIGVAGCGGNQTPVEEPTAQAESDSESVSSAPEETSTTDEEVRDSEPAPSEPASSKVTRSPKDVVTAEGALFTFSFRDSEAYQRAEQSCTEKSGDDPKKKGDCMSKASNQFQADSLWFKKDEEGKWWWLAIRKRGSSLQALNKIPIEFGEETETTITIQTKGRDQGSQPMRHVPAQITIEVPSESQIVLEDPKHGKMVYHAKFGLIGESER